MKYHTHTPLRLYIQASDETLKLKFPQEEPEAVRALFMKQDYMGHLFHQECDCDGFSPQLGCPGHLTEDDAPVKPVNIKLILIVFWIIVAIILGYLFIALK